MILSLLSTTLAIKSEDLLVSKENADCCSPISKECLVEVGVSVCRDFMC